MGSANIQVSTAIISPDSYVSASSELILPCTIMMSPAVPECTADGSEVEQSVPYSPVTMPVDSSCSVLVTIAAPLLVLYRRRYTVLLAIVVALEKSILTPAVIK